MATQWAFASWAETPVNNRVQTLFRMKALVGKLLDELTYLLAQEQGKKWPNAIAFEKMSPYWLSF